MKTTKQTAAKQWDELWTGYIAAVRAKADTSELKSRISAWHVAQGWPVPAQFA